MSSNELQPKEFRTIFHSQASMDYEYKKRVNKKFASKEKFKMNGGKTAKHIRVMEAQMELRERKLKASGHDKSVETAVINGFTTGVGYKSFLNK